MMERTTLGPLSVSSLALGAMLFGTEVEETLSRRLLDSFVAAGGDFIDTSNNYAFWPENGFAGSSEQLLGRWLKSRGRRDDLVIATKVGALPNRVGAGLEDIEGLGKATIIADIDASLKRLAPTMSTSTMPISTTARRRWKRPWKGSTRWYDQARCGPLPAPTTPSGAWSGHGS